MFSPWNFFASNNGKNLLKPMENDKVGQNDREDRVVVIPEDSPHEDPLVSRLLEWNTELENKLRENKAELASLSHQLIALTGKQIFLQDKKDVVEEKLATAENRFSELKEEIKSLERENKLLSLRLEFVMRTKEYSPCESPLITQLV